MHDPPGVTTNPHNTDELAAGDGVGDGDVVVARGFGAPGMLSRVHPSIVNTMKTKDARFMCSGTVPLAGQKCKGRPFRLSTAKVRRTRPSAGAVARRRLKRQEQERDFRVEQRPRHRAAFAFGAWFQKVKGSDQSVRRPG